MKYSIILQNTLTKKPYVFNVEDIGSSLFYNFEIDVATLDEGEYKLFLITNDEWSEITINPTNIEESKMGNETINIITTDVMRIGNFTATTTKYNSVKNFKTYNG